VNGVNHVVCGEKSRIFGRKISGAHYPPKLSPGKGHEIVHVLPLTLVPIPPGHDGNGRLFTGHNEAQQRLHQKVWTGYAWDSGMDMEVDR
jgi:hypothetical protein